MFLRICTATDNEGIKIHGPSYYCYAMKALLFSILFRFSGLSKPSRNVCAEVIPFKPQFLVRPVVAIGLEIRFRLRCSTELRRSGQVVSQGGRAE
jgi:hypothetical protein